MLDFERVFRENNCLVFRFLMKLCGDVSLAEELTQETFFRAYMNLSSLRDEGRVSAWLYQIAKNTYFAWFNDQKRQKSIAQLVHDLSAPDIAERFEEKDLAERAFACLGALEGAYREVFMLYTFGELSLKEISIMFGKSESWARVTFYRAKQRIIGGLGKSDEL